MICMERCDSWEAAEEAATTEAAAWLQAGYVPCGVTLLMDREQHVVRVVLMRGYTEQVVTGGALRFVRFPTVYQGPKPDFEMRVAGLGGASYLNALTGSQIPGYAVAHTVYGSGQTLWAVEGWGPRWLALQAGAALDQFELEPLRRLRWEAWAEAWWAEAAMGFDGRSALAMPATAASSLLEAAYRCIMPADWPKITLQRFHAWERWHGMTRTAVMVRGWEEVVQDLVQHATLWACL